MTGQELYEFYARAELQTSNCTVEHWDELAEERRAVWELTAELVEENF
jgi:hypothetical protein